jgi:hypothetical protein
MVLGTVARGQDLLPHSFTPEAVLRSMVALLGGPPQAWLALPSGLDSTMFKTKPCSRSVGHLGHARAAS